MKKPAIIVAVATAAGRSGIGVVRLSGTGLAAFIHDLVGRPLPPRRAVLTDFFGEQSEVIDRGIALYYPAPHSYTGEDVLELQGHGGPVVMQLLLKRCQDLGARIAAPGEFTQRAYLNDKLDLAQAEAVADLIDASTAQAARSAVRSLRGAFSQRIDALSRELIELRALVEATLDFPEEEIDFLKHSEVESRLVYLREQLLGVLAASRQGSLLRDGVHIVLAGRPNVGKSSLLNRLAGEELAIVTEIPGTTRDAIRLSVDMNGVPAHIIDTAGLRESQDPVEQMGMARTWAVMERADVVVVMMDATSGETAADRAILDQLPAGLPRLYAMNKIDLTGGEPATVREGSRVTVWLSAMTGDGLSLLRGALLELVGWEGEGEGMFIARARHVEALEAAYRHVEQAMAVAERPELLAEELRVAHDTLGAITGRYTSDDLLGEIFSRFCVGK